MTKLQIKPILVATALLLLFQPGPAAEPIRMNNMVTQLLELPEASMQANSTLTFMNPREGWVFIAVGNARQITLRLNEERTPLALHGDSTLEAMRFLPQGAHQLHVGGKDATKASLVLRAIPEIHYCRHPADPVLDAYGPYDWAFLQQHILPQVNVIVGRPTPEVNSRIDEWTQLGRKWIAYGGLPHGVDLTADAAYTHWAENPGFQDPRLSGLIADEFQGRQAPEYPAWTEALLRMGATPEFEGKNFYGYCGGPGMFTRPQTRTLVRAMFEAGYYMAYERYHHEMPTLHEGLEFMDSLLGEPMLRWRDTFPGCQKQMVLVLGLFTSGLSLNVQPEVDYKVWMDLQMQFLAMHPAYDGLFGVHWWNSGLSDEESIRWLGQLYRHYCIEGNTELLSKQYGYRYLPGHVRNPDFAEELDGWTVLAAEEQSVWADYREFYARLQTRYWHRAEFPDEPSGNAFLHTRRSSDKPNTVSQPITNLIPGQLYSVKVRVADYRAITDGRAEEALCASSVSITGGELLPERSFKGLFNSRYSSKHERDPFKHNKTLAWFTQHRLVFRATDNIGRITISDWESDTDPGGPAGQELMFNFVEVQPYFLK